MDMRVHLARIDQALLQAHQERTQDHQRTRDHQTAVDTCRLQRADVVLLALTAGSVFVWTMGGVTLALQLAGYS